MSDRTTMREPGLATLRVAGASGIPTILRKFGIDPIEVLTDANLNPRLFDDPDSLITVGVRERLMSCCVAVTGCQHFGLLVGQQMNLSSLGLIGLLTRSMPDVGVALRTLGKYLYLHSQGSRLDLRVDTDLAVVTFGSSVWGEGASQIGDGALAQLLNVLRTLCGDGFQPIDVRFSHHKPVDTRPFRRFFQAPLWFDAEDFSLAFSPHWLDVELPGSDAEVQRLLQKQIDALDVQHSLDFPEQVRSVLHSAILTGHSNLKDVAAIFSLPSWTFSRRLESFNTGFQKLVDETRFDMARQMLEDSSLEVRQIADYLGYSRSSMFIRAFRRWSGTTPIRWRETHAQEILPGQRSSSGSKPA